LSTLEDTTVDVPRAPDYVGGMFAQLVIAGVFSLAQVGKLVNEGGTEPGSLVQLGDGLILIGIVLDSVRKDKSEAAMIDMYRESKVNLEDFVSPDDKKKAGKFETFLERKNLQCLYPVSMRVVPLVTSLFAPTVNSCFLHMKLFLQFSVSTITESK
jgi:hypothetical protein